MYGKELKAQRLKAGLTQTELAKRAKISQQNISRWERDDIEPTIDFCVKLANFYGITLDELIGREIPKNWDNYFDQRNNKGTITNNIR